MKTLLRRVLALHLLCALAWPACAAWACTTILVGRNATGDNSVSMASSCDGDIMGVIYVMPAHDDGRPTQRPMYWNLPRPKNLAEYDVTRHPAFNPQGKRSPLARPWGPPELFELLGIRPERAISTPSSGYVFIAQLREQLPPPIGNCLWFAYGPADTSCFAPVYAGVTGMPAAWDRPADFARIDRAQAWADKTPAPADTKTDPDFLPWAERLMAERWAFASAYREHFSAINFSARRAS